MKAAARLQQASSSHGLDQKGFWSDPRQTLRVCGQLVSAAVSLTAVPAKSSLEVFASRFRESVSGSFVFPPLARDLFFEIASRHLSPNQAPEPTRTSVTPRAFARVAPAARVAHL
jgi:hypothetical protein